MTIAGETPLVRLEAVGLHEAKPAIDAGAGESAQVIFSFHGGGKTPLAGKLAIIPVGEIDVAFPAPRVAVPVALQYPDEGLVAVCIGDLVAASVLVT